MVDSPDAHIMDFWEQSLQKEDVFVMGVLTHLDSVANSIIDVDEVFPCRSRATRT